MIDPGTGVIDLHFVFEYKISFSAEKSDFASIFSGQLISLSIREPWVDFLGG